MTISWQVIRVGAEKRKNRVHAPPLAATRFFCDYQAHSSRQL
jgi:hypothetical protein